MSALAVSQRLGSSRPSVSRRTELPVAHRGSWLSHSGRRTICKPVAAVEIDWSDPDTLVGAFACVSGIALGIGTLVWYGKVVERDEERLQTLRELNKATYESTGEYLSEDEIEKIRVPKWTDRREFKDND